MGETNSEQSTSTTLSNEEITNNYIQKQNSKAGYFFIGFSILGLVIAFLFHCIGLGTVQEFRESEMEVLGKNSNNTSLHQVISEKLKQKNYTQNMEDFFKSKLDILKNSVETNENSNTYEKYKGIYGALKGGIIEQDTSISKILVKLFYDTMYKNKEKTLNAQKVSSTFLDGQYTTYVDTFIYLIGPIYFLITKVFLTSSFMNYYYNYDIMNSNDEGFISKCIVVILQIIGFFTGIIPTLIPFYNSFTVAKRFFMPSYTFSPFNNKYILLGMICMFIFYTFSTSYFWLILLGLNTYVFMNRKYLNIVLPILLIGTPFICLCFIFFYTMIQTIYKL